MKKIEKWLVVFNLFIVVLIGQLYAKEYVNTSYYVAYNSVDKTQFALVMPAVKKIYTHQAGHISVGDLKEIDPLFESFPTYSDGKLCFHALASSEKGENGASIMANHCYEVKFFYTQKELTSDGKMAFILTYTPSDTVYEGVAGDSQSFKVVKTGNSIRNQNSITNENYKNFLFYTKTAKVVFKDNKNKDDNNDTVAIKSLSISGDPIEVVDQYTPYRFTPLIKKEENDKVTFTIVHKPDWAEFNTTTGVLRGVPLHVENDKNITIRVTNGVETSILPSFTIRVLPAQDIAHLFGQASQGDMYGSHYAKYAIDDNATTYNHADDSPPNNWWQLKLPDGVKIYKIVLFNNHRSYRLENAKMYLNDSNHTHGSSDMGSLSKILGADKIQVFTYNPPVEKSYILMQGNVEASGGDKSLHLNEVKVYGTLPVMPNHPMVFSEKMYDFGLDVNASAGTPIGVVHALNYVKRDIKYTLIDEEVPFAIDERSGLLTLAETIDHNQIQHYTFKVTANDGQQHKTVAVKVNLLSLHGVREERWNDISGTSISSFLDADHYRKDAPDEIKIVDNLDMPSSYGDNFGQKMQAVLRPLSGGEYCFAIIGDDATQLRLNHRVIASKNGWGSYRKWDDAAKSRIVHLNAGEIYPIEAFLKEGGGSEHISVGWKKIDDNNFTVIPASELFVETLDRDNVKPQFLSHLPPISLKSIDLIGERVTTVAAFDSQGDTLHYRILDSVPFDIDNEGTIEVSGSLEAKTYTFKVEVSDGNAKAYTTVTVKSSTDTHSLNETKQAFDSNATAFTSESDVDTLIESYLSYAHAKAKDIYSNFMDRPLEKKVWDWIEGDHYLKEGLYASRFPVNPYVVKNLADFKTKFTAENNATLLEQYKNLILGLSVNAKERGIEQEARFGGTWEHRTIDYEKLAQYEEKERVWREEHTLKDLGYGIGYYDFRNYLYLKYDLSASESNGLWGVTGILRKMANENIDIETADYKTRKQYGLSFDGINLYRLSKGLKRLDCYDDDNPCQQIQTWLDNNGSVTKTEFFSHFKTYKKRVDGLIDPRDDMANELSEWMGLVPDKYRLMSFYDLAKWKISMDRIDAVDFNDSEPNWPLFNVPMHYNSSGNAYPWQLMALEQSAQKQECQYVKDRFFETDKSKLIDSYPPHAIDNGDKQERRFIQYTTYTWAYDAPEVWFRKSAWSPHRTVYRILQDGGVCGRQSTMGQHVNECLNRPSIGVGQPGHRAWVGVYTHPAITNQYYVDIGYQVGSKESATTGINSIYDRYTKGIRDRGLERFGGVVTGVSPANAGEHLFNQSMILQHIGKILETEDVSPDTVLKKAIEIAPTNIDAWYQLARYYAGEDTPQKVIDLATTFMKKRAHFYLDDNSSHGGENLEVIVGKVIAFIALEAPSIQNGKGEDAETFKSKLWSYLDTYEKEYRSYRTYGYQNRYLAQLYLVENNDTDGFESEVETLFDRFLSHSTSGWYYDNYFKNVYWGDVNKTALFDTLQEKTDEAQISDHQRAKIYEKILGRGQGVALATIILNDLCNDSNLSTCHSLKRFMLDAKAVYMVSKNNEVGDDEEVDPAKRGVAGYSTLVIPVVDNTGKELNMKLHIAKVATKKGLEGTLLKINDPTEVETDKTEIVAWIGNHDNQLDANRTYTARHRIVLKAKKRVKNNEESMGNLILNIQEVIPGETLTIKTDNWSSPTLKDDTTSIYFVALDKKVGATSGVWAKSGYNILTIPVEDEDGAVKNIKLRAKNDSSWTMNSALNADWDNTLNIYYESEDNNLTSGVRYKSLMPMAIDAKMWHKGNKLFKRYYLNFDMVLP